MVCSRGATGGARGGCEGATKEFCELFEVGHCCDRACGEWIRGWSVRSIWWMMGGARALSIRLRLEHGMCVDERWKMTVLERG